MQRIDIAIFPSLLLFVAGSLLELMGQAPGSPAPRPASASVCPDDIGWTGKYTNHSYGFAVTIPQRLTGYWNSPPCSKGPDGYICMSDHGRIIPLTPEPHEP